MSKADKIRTLIAEAMQIAPDLRKGFSHNHMSSDKKISHHQLYTLILIKKHETLSMGELADKLGVSNQQLTRIMDGLVSLGLVKRYVDPVNRRLVLTEMNSKGNEMILEIETAMKDQMISVLSVLSEEEIDESVMHLKALKRILGKVTENNEQK